MSVIENFAAEMAQVTSEAANHLRDGLYRPAFEVVLRYASTDNNVIDVALLSVLMTMAIYRAGRT